jgi:hypothetical protein
MAKRIKQYSNLTYKEQQLINKLLKKNKLSFIDINFNQQLKKAVIIKEEEDELLVIMNIEYTDEDDDDEDDDDENEIVEEELEVEVSEED